MPANWRICMMFPRAPEFAIMKMGLVGVKPSSMASLTPSVAWSRSR